MNNACAPGWCQCAPGQGCADGVCTDIITTGPGANNCSADRQSGLCADNAACCHKGTVCCAGGEVCVGDSCVPDQRPCSPQDPTGWCGPFGACVQGVCQLLDQCACSATNPTGCCADGAACQNGACVVEQCSASVAGECVADYVCTTTGCTRLPCSPGHTNGSCTTGFCSAAGTCIPSGTCAARGDCSLAQYCASDSTCHKEGTCLTTPDCVAQFGDSYTCNAGICSSTSLCKTNTDCTGANEYCSAKGICVGNGCCGADDDCGSGQSCVDRGACDTCVTRLSCAQASDCPPAYTCNTTTNTCTASGTACNGNDFTASCASPGPGQPAPLECCVSGETCCPYGQLCAVKSTADMCIPLGRCIDKTDCLSGFTCSNFVCVPTTTNECPCTAGNHCASIPLPDGTIASGCVPNTECAWALDCPSGYRCNASYQCELDPQCGDVELATGSFVPPNVLIVFDRSASMNLCGPGDPAVGHCGYNFGTCTDASSCTAFTAEATDGSMECTPFAPGKVCSDDGCDFYCANPPTCTTTSTETRWSEALNAIDTLLTDYVNEVSFGLSMFPHSPGDGSEKCPIVCNWLSCTESNPATGTLAPGVIDVPVGFGTKDTIVAKLGSSAPYGSTPTAATLRDVLALSDHGGLNALDRADAIVLVTDGDPTGDLTILKTCEPPCSNLIKDGDETAVDCGGQCGPCATLKSCITNDDCLTSICRDNLCRATTCTDGTKDSGETDVDCGGPCQGCADTLACTANTDCQSKICGASSTCVAPLCNDSVMNGAETGVDCGGGCTTTCADNTGCLTGADCTSAFCDATLHVCKPSHCTNGTMDSGETGVDCGGTCKACPTLCTNGVLDAGETDIDCGGSSCPACGGAKTCTGTTDCISGACTVCGGTASSSDQVCLVDAAIDRLYAATPRVKTFVIGFENSGSAALNCNAVHGKTANPAVAGCNTLTRATCGDNSAPTCYYNATNAAALATALDTVIKQVSSCRFALDQTPPDRYKVSVYLEDPAHPADRILATPNIQYNYDPSFNQIEFLGTTCTDVKSGARLPIVIFGCAEGGS